ncbi:MAG: S9 family peptidase [Bacteroidetes bacterium]|nr:MAG: S9 family peptidase [Bacteroidota bacterium]
MKKNLLLLLLLGLVPLRAFSQEKAPAFAPLDVFALEYASDPQISPDGRWVVYVRNRMDIMKDKARGELWLLAVDGSVHRKLTSREAGESSPRWSPDGTRIAFVSGTEEGAEVFLYWLESGQHARLSQLERSPRGLSWSPDGRQLAFSMLVPEKEPQIGQLPPKPKGAQWADPPRVITRLKHESDGSGYEEPGYYHLFVLPAEGGSPRQVSSGNFHHRSTPEWSPDGKSLIFSANRNPDWEYEFINSEIYTLNLQSGTIRALTDRNGPDHSPALSPDGKYIAYLGFDDRMQTYQLTRLYLMNADGTNKRLLTADLDRSVRNPRWAPDGRGILFEYDDRGITRIGYVDLQGQVRTVAENLGGTSLGRPYGGGSFSVARNGAIAYTYTRPEHPADVGLVSPDGKWTRLTRLNDDLLPHRTLGSVEEIWWKSSFDGRDIQGWVVKPPHYDPSKKFPLLLEIHGGPITNYGERFSAEIQLYAAAGYVVLYANPRGSTGYGEAFANLLHHNYPGEDYDDLMSGVDALIEQGLVHPDSLFVTGGSAGGIMTAWIIGKTDRFRAAAVVKPVMNWYSKVLTADNYYFYHERRYPGHPWTNPEAYLKFSPISLVGNVRTPTLVMVGTADLRTPPSEARQLYHALKLCRIETAYVEIPGASHNIARRPSQLIAKVANVLGWFERYR